MIRVHLTCIAVAFAAAMLWIALGPTGFGLLAAAAALLYITFDVVLLLCDKEGSGRGL